MEGTWSQRPGEGLVGVGNAILYRTREVNPSPSSSLSHPRISLCLSIRLFRYHRKSRRGFSSLKDHEDRRFGGGEKENRKPTVLREKIALDKDDFCIKIEARFYTRHGLPFKISVVFLFT